MLHRDVGENPQPEEWMANEFAEAFPVISPDEKWLAYWSTEGFKKEIYVRPMDDSMGPQMLSNAGGYRPRWLQTGDQYQVIYQGFGSFSTIYSVSFTPQGNELDRGEPTESFTHPEIGFGDPWTVSRDGQRFLVLVDAPDEDSEGEASTEAIHLEMVSNWFTELNKLVPPVSDN